MKLIVGLGNPGPQYARTRHNAGFMVLDQLATDFGAAWKAEPKLKSELSRSESLILAKPQTFMNVSGEAVHKIMQFYKISPSDVWVVFDDVDVPFGRLRLRRGGTSGHQGIRSLIQHIGPDFIRVRFGISLNDRTRESSEHYVLKPFNPDERQHLPAMITQTANILANQITLESPEETTLDLIS